MAKRKLTFTEQLRQAVLNAPVSRYEIWKQTGIGQPSLSRFVSGETGLSLDSIDILVKYLGLELKPAASTHVRRRKRKDS